MALERAAYRPREAPTAPACLTKRAARLVDGVLPHVPVCQWALSLPHRLRYILAWDHRLCLAVLGVVIRAFLDFYHR